MGAPPGEGYPADGEGPPHRVALSPFSISPVAVTNADFDRLTAATGSPTGAEADG